MGEEAGRLELREEFPSIKNHICPNRHDGKGRGRVPTRTKKDPGKEHIKGGDLRNKVQAEFSLKLD